MDHVHPFFFLEFLFGNIFNNGKAYPLIHEMEHTQGDFDKDRGVPPDDGRLERIEGNRVSVHRLVHLIFADWQMCADAVSG